MTNTEKAQAVVDKITDEHRENIALKEQAKSFEQTLKEVREGLVSVPVAGENWRNTANYITGDTMVYLGATYTALKYNKGKSPDVNPDFWKVTESVPSAIAWSDIPQLKNLLDNGDIAFVCTGKRKSFAESTVSELRFITVESVKKGYAEIENKGKIRTILLPADLIKLLLQYSKKHGIKSGSIFVTKTGKPLNRSNIWAEMKKLCKAAGVDEKKVFPHNLRRHFAVRFYNKVKDLSKLADVLGHANINTTRIYLKGSGAEHRRIIDCLGLVKYRFVT